MAHPLRLVSGADHQRAARPAFVPSSDDQERRLRESPASDLALVRFSRVNVLIVGDDDLVATLVTSLLRSLATPVVVRSRWEPLRLSPTYGRVGTIVVYDVDTLTGDEQLALYHSLGEGRGRTRVVSTASKSLETMVEAGAFDAELYYRLNIVTLDLSSHVKP